MANDGEEVCNDDGQLFLGAGAEPLSTSRLSVGHQMFDRPVEISERLEETIGGQSLNKGIDIADDALKRQAVEEIRSMFIDKGSALKSLTSGSDGGSRLISNDRNSPRPA